MYYNYVARRIKALGHGVEDNACCCVILYGCSEGSKEAYPRNRQQPLYRDRNPIACADLGGGHSVEH